MSVDSKCRRQFGIGNLHWAACESLLLTLLGLLELEDGKQLYSTYHMNYETVDHRKPIYVDVGDLSRWMSQQAKVGMFAPHSGVLLLDEGYSGMDRVCAQKVGHLVV